MAKSEKKSAILKKAIGKVRAKDNEKDNGKKESAAHEKSESCGKEKSENGMGKKFGNLMKAVKK